MRTVNADAIEREKRARQLDRLNRELKKLRWNAAAPAIDGEPWKESVNGWKGPTVYGLGKTFVNGKMIDEPVCTCIHSCRVSIQPIHPLDI